MQNGNKNGNIKRNQYVPFGNENNKYMYVFNIIPRGKKVEI